MGKDSGGRQSRENHESPGCEARAMLVACEHRDSLPFVLRFELINYTATSGTNKDSLAHSTQDTLKRTGP